MKKIIYLLCSLLVAVSACDPMEEVYEELDKAPEEKRVLAITLTEANYKSLEGKKTADGKSVPAYVSTGQYFTSEKEAGEIIPIYLNTTFAHLNNRDAIDVTYNTSAPATVTERETYVLTDADYALGGATFKNFDSFTQVETFLNAKYPTPVEGRLVTLTFTSFNNNTNPTSKTVTNTYFYANGKWYDTYRVTANDYLSVERNRNNAFTAADEAEFIPAALNKFLQDTIVGAKPGDIKYSSYLVRYSSSSTLQQVFPLFFDGNNWVRTRPATLSFVKKDGKWVADPILRYTLSSQDYIWIGDNASLGTEKNRANLKQFKSFYQRFSDDDRYWTQSQVIAALGALLKSKYPTAPEGQKFEVTYVIHTGPTGPTTLVLQLVDGVYVVPED